MSIEKDYLGNKLASIKLARTIESYWHKQGFANVRAWVETVPGFENTFQVRTNIKMDAAQ
jgi:hypothetical protein